VTTSEHAERFTYLRPLLFTIVYEILGSATESDDVLQDSYLRWADVDLATVRDTKSYLAQLVTSQALNALRTRARRREAVRKGDLQQRARRRDLQAGGRLRV
jgi:RNA polymerase sigma-70 factor (ECF subfamily)